MTISKGEKIRRQVMGEDFVDRALKNADEFTQPMQDFINDHGWGSTWQRGGIDLKTRSLVTVAMLAALRTPQELKGHIRGALNNGATIEEIREVLLHSAVYCGAPAAQEAFRAAKEVLNNE
jgi:4-carboxymuconolactone decarboxylase